MSFIKYCAMIFFMGCFTRVVAFEKDMCLNYCRSLSSLGILESNPGASCNDIYELNEDSKGVSTYYWIQTSTGVHQVYCDMELECSGIKGGWMRIADLDTSRGDDCPTGWSKITTSDNATYPSKDVCGSTRNKAGCYSARFSVNGSSYNKICGKARGYQRSTPDAFAAIRGNKNIDGPYVDGLSITIGSYPNRTHVWTYAAGVSNGRGNQHKHLNCPCSDFPGSPPPSFVGEHYYCEFGNVGPLRYGIFYTNDPLWDGEGCKDNNKCCDDASLPWFTRQLPEIKQDDVEVRICHDQAVDDEDVVIDQLQLFVQ